jgi:hypothetical protein
MSAGVNTRTRGRRAWIAGLAALLLAGSASADDVSAGGSVPRGAAEVVKVRVGNHPTYTRVVFELDAAAGYRVEKLRGHDGISEIRVTLEASAPPIEVERKTVMVERVALDQGRGRSVAHIRLQKTPSRVKEMILANPPRIVFDLVFPEQQLAAIRRAKQREAAAKAKAAEQVAEREAAAATTEPAPKPTEPSSVARVEKRPASVPKPLVPTPAPTAKAEPPKPTPAAKPPVPTPAPVAKTEPPKPTPATKPPVPTPAPTAKAEPPKPTPATKPPVPTPAPVAKAEPPKPMPATKPPPAPVAKAEPPKSMAAAKPPAEKPAPEEKAQLAKPAMPEPGKAAREIKSGTVVGGRKEGVPGERVEAPEARQRPAPAPPAARPAPAQKPPGARPADAAAKPRPAPGLLEGIDLVFWGSVAAGALLLVLLVVLLMRRRSLPNDMDVTALLDEHEGAIPDGGFSMDASLDEGGAPLDAATVAESFNRGASAPRDESRPAEVDIAAGPGLFEEEEPEKESEKMDVGRTGMEQTSSEMPTQFAGAAGGADLARVVRDLERRMAQLETRLDESTEARERLERQVAAQAEELRVQRAAIARTQRALRSLNRPAEEQATEPALRDQS